MGGGAAGAAAAAEPVSVGAHPSDRRWSASSLYTPVRTIGVIERPREAEDVALAAPGRTVPFGFGVRKPHYRWDHSTGEWVRT